MFATGESNRAIALTEGFQSAFLACVGFALAGAVLAALMISSKDSREHAEAARAEGAEAVPVAG